MSSVYHAHFDCFSGAAGDMMLAACLDAADDPQQLADRIVKALVDGLPSLKGEFALSFKRVWRGMGSISALYVNVESIYEHEPAPLPRDESAVTATTERETGASRHTHAHQQQHRQHYHSHDHTHHENTHDNFHDHAHEHGHIENNGDEASESSHSHRHQHQNSNQQDPYSTKKLRNLPEIRQMLQDADPTTLPPWVTENAIAAFTELAHAEAAVHGVSTVDSVHFHEVGAIDSIVDTVGTLLALHFLNVESLSCSPLPLGEGVVWTDHGLLPVPAPATLRLMIGMRTTPGPPCRGELVTPTAAALLRVLTSRTKSTPQFTVRRVGVGAGSKDFVKHPNILRLILGETFT